MRKPKISDSELPDYVEVDKKLAKTGNAVYPTLVVRWNPSQRSGALTAEDLANMSEEAILKVRLPQIVVQEYAKKIDQQKKEIEEKEKVVIVKNGKRTNAWVSTRSTR